MTFCFQVDESIAKGTKRMARKQIDRALKQLTLPTRAGQEEAVHEARKRFKRIRALLRLVRKAIGKRLYARENACFRDAGRALAEVRDAHVLVAAWEELTGHLAAEVSRPSLAEVSTALLRCQEAVTSRLFDEERELARVVGILDAARRRIKKWTFANNGRCILHAGLKRVYKRGREAFSTALAEPTMENLHAWRKRVKDLWLQLQVLKPLWPAINITAKLVNQTHTLSNHLGADHDLAMLRTVLAGHSAQLGDRAAVEALLPLIDRRRSELQQAAHQLGQQVYRDKPKGFLRRIEVKH